jgi:hypothetical protein
VLQPDPELAVAYGIFSVQQARSAGYADREIRRTVERGRWHRSGFGLLEVVGRESQSGDQLVRDVVTAGSRAVVGYAAAAKLHGWDLPALPPTPTVIVPPGARAQGVRAYRARLREDDVALFGVVMVTIAARTAIDLASVLPVEKAVITLDSALRSGQVNLPELDAKSRERRVGIRAARRALALADPSAGSVAESEARLLFHDAGLPPPLSQFAVDLGDLMARLDFAWPAQRVLVEIDGREWHVGPGPFQRDRTRQNALVQAGWLVLRFTVEDIRSRPEYVVSEVRRALSR